MDLKRAHVQVSGKVQGVWYRDSTLKEAPRLGVVGWVRNLVVTPLEQTASTLPHS